MGSPRAVYPTDLSHFQWAIIYPLIPPSKPIGADRHVSIRAVVNGVLYRERSGCSWRMLPHDFPHWRTVYGYFRQWKQDGTWEQICAALRRSARRRARKQTTAVDAISLDGMAGLVLQSQACCSQPCGDGRASA